MEVGRQHVSAAGEKTRAEMHIGDLEDLESTIVAEPERKMRPLLDANRSVVEQ